MVDVVQAPVTNTSPKGIEGQNSFSASSSQEAVVCSLCCYPRINNSARVAGKQSRDYNAGESLRIVIGLLPEFRRFYPITGSDGLQSMDEINNLMQRANRLALVGSTARRQGNEAAAEKSFRGALDLAMDAARLAKTLKSSPTRIEALQTAALLALEFGNVADARRLMVEAAAADPSATDASQWKQLREISEWPDHWLVAAVRRDPPDEAALDTLVDRHWKTLFARCHILTLNHEKAKDLAQDVWRRVLRARHNLKPGGNFPAYLTTIATNLWRDVHRAALRAGPMAESRMDSLDVSRTADEENAVTLSDILPDLKSLQADEQKRFALDIDAALGRLDPVMRDVIISRFITGESCAEIGKRYRRTEQTVSGWVRQALREMKDYLRDSADPSLFQDEK